MFKVHFTNLKDQPGVGGVYRRLAGRPAWVWGTALLIGVLPFAIAIGILAIAALLSTAIVLAVLTAVDKVIQSIAGLFGGSGSAASGSDGRRNVTVVRPDEAG